MGNNTIREKQETIGKIQCNKHCFQRETAKIQEIQKRERRNIT